MSAVVLSRIEDGVAVITFDNPPVNALSHAVRAALVEAIEAAEADETAKAIVLIAAGRTFPAGADVSEFGRPPADPWLPAVCDRIEAAKKPVVAAIHGTALGGGFEVALAAHYRLASEDARIGLPEVTLGIVPGAGGTQRAPRLCGAEAALEIIVGGKPLGSDTAADLGLIDGVVEGDLESAAIAFAADLAGSGQGPRPTSQVTQGFEDPAAYAEAIAERRKALAGSPLLAPMKAVDCVEAALLLPFEAGLAFERAAFEDLVASDQSKALRHMFFAERRAAKFPGLEGATPRQISRVGIVGGGTMGAGIAATCLHAGLPVILLERDDKALESGIARVTDIFDRAVKRGRLKPKGRDKRLALLTGTLDYADFSEADLVIEAVFEDLDAKRAVFAELDAVLKPGAILATNTSYISVNKIAKATARPGDVIGLHFFSPANVMRLLEIVVAKRTAPEVVATALALARRLGKTPVRSEVSDGFVANRVLVAYRKAADELLEDGASVEDIDAAMRAFGMPLGPYEVADLAGLDISWARRKRLAESRDPAERYVAIGDRLCEAGRFGQKNGKGYYLYEPGARGGRPDPEVARIVEAERAAKGIRPRRFGREEIARRCVLAMANEGAKLVEEGIALRPSDVDVAMVHGFGFPRWQGGPMKWADLQGLPAVLRDLRSLAPEDPHLWTPSPLLSGLIEAKAGFDSLNR